MPLFARVRQAWNAFRSNEERTRPKSAFDDPYDYTVRPGPGASSSPTIPRLQIFNERSIVSSIYTRIAIDVASIDIRHVLVDEDERFVENVKSGLNQCLLLEPNMDQAPRAFRQNIVMTMLDKGVSAIVPVDTVQNPENTADFEILTLRVGDITQWYPQEVLINLYNEATGLRQDVRLEKRFVAIAENPLYAVMNEPNSTLQRLIRKLQLLDVVDEQSSSGKLDIIIQLPYTVKSEARREQANRRRVDLESQLKGSQYGVAYTDVTEKITQLNRPAENNLLKQVELLTEMLYSQLGLTKEVMLGTADEAAMLNYYNRTIEPILDTIVQAMQRSFLGILGTHKMERVRYFRDPFKLVPVAQLAEIGDKMTRNEILTSNELRGIMGVRPSKDPKADQLRNSNVPQPEPPEAETSS